MVCLPEEDYGILWKQFDWRTNYPSAPAPPPVVSFIATVGNH
jgi:Cu2+-containing amine oxidase